MVETTIISVERLPIRLVKVVKPNGHQIVVGGRLVSETVDGVTIPHPDLPEYGIPENIEELVAFILTKDDELKRLGVVRAGTLLGTPRDPDRVRAWIRDKGGRA